MMSSKENIICTKLKFHLLEFVTSSDCSMLLRVGEANSLITDVHKEYGFLPSSSLA